MSNQSELRLTETNSGQDSGGKTWGLEGNLFWYVVGATFGSVLILLLLYSCLRWTFGAATALAALPLILALAYVFTLRQGKPRGYDLDLIQQCVTPPGLSPERRSPKE